jgi:FxsC-like protein
VRGGVVTLSAEWAPRLRPDSGGYGAAPGDWKPFLPETADPALGLLHQVVAGGGYLFKPLPPGAALLPALDEASAMGNLVCLAVDPWVMNVQELAAECEALDGRDLANVAVVVMWDAGERTRLVRSLLESRLRAVFPRTMEGGRLLSVGSARALQAELAALLERLRMEVIEAAAQPSLTPVDIG